MIRRIVIGVGNRERGDDAAGRAVAQLLQGTLPGGADVIEHDGEAADLIEAFGGAAEVFIVDACVSGAPAGTVRRMDATATALPRAVFSMSSHGLGLAEAIELARALGRLPPVCVVYAIEGECFALGAPLSPSVAAAVSDVAARLCCEIDR